MVDVLVQGDPGWEVTCTKGCKSKLKAYEKDLQVENTAVAYAGETWDPVLYIVCPVCGVRVYNGLRRVVPAEIENRIFQKARHRS